MSLALARKYRPDRFDDLIGQETIAQTLSLALTTKRLSHAYLFSGVRGSGKTSTARIFAKALICEQGESPSPCGICSHCTMASSNSHMDIIEMDGASNRGIDDIKELIEHTKYQPSSARYKIFIIDEVHMLTTQAFNALLKTLEEPPSFVKFILATTDPLKLPATILSRTQHFRFHKIAQDAIEAHLEHILTLEEIEFEPNALHLLARTASGSLRDALTLTDQAIIYSKNFIDTPTVSQMLGIIEPSHLDRLLADILSANRDKIIAFVKASQSYEAQMILNELTLHLKTLLLSQDSRIAPPIMERFLQIIAQSTQLLHIGADEEFLLALTLFKMIEAVAPLPSLQHQTTPPKEPPKASIPTPQTPPPSDPTPPKATTPFEQLIHEIHKHDRVLGEVFTRSVSFKSFEGGRLTWESCAQGEDKRRLITHWAIIRMLVQEIFGDNTKIVNLSKEEPKKSDPSPKIEEHDSDQMKSSCIAPEAGESASAQEKDPSTLMQEPMIKEAIALLDPKKVRIKRNS
jgi:DNA polymerase-3 subunit gamma/tau